MAVDKLVDSTQLDADLASVAAAIRTKGGTSAQLAFPAGFVSAIQAIPTGGGGASNFVTGTFKGTTTGAAMDVSLDYSGTGYPIAWVIYPTEGVNKTNGVFATLIQRYAIRDVAYFKGDPSTAPRYREGAALYDGASYTGRYKSNASNASSYGSNSNDNYSTFSQNDANAGSFGNCVKIKSNKLMSVFIASTYYGFAANIEYTYYVIYSS